jgi:hypothetical protein
MTAQRRRQPRHQAIAELFHASALHANKLLLGGVEPMILRRISCAVIAAVLTTTSVSAYEIRIRRPFVKKADVHETITALAEDCLKNHKGAPPSGCWTTDEDVAARSNRHDEAYSDLQLAAKWPDDPTRQDRGASFPKIGYNMQRGCKKLTAESRTMEVVGLLCSSHFGKLQFLHAQAVAEDSTAADTYDRILAWADFAFRAARNEALPSGQAMLDANYCEFMMSEPAALRDMMKCTGNDYRLYNVSTFFALTCARPFGSSTCGSPSDATTEDSMAKLAARGALLHLVQDSFSQSHTSRAAGETLPPNGPNGGFMSKVVCLYPTAYFNYADQRAKAHARADKPPTRDSSCLPDAAGKPPQTDDVATASAMLLWHIKNGTRESLRDYLVSRVFGPRPGSTIN